MNRRHAFTLVELLVVIGVIGILVALMMPAINNIRGAARQTHCQSNLKQCGLAMDVYLDSQGPNGKYPYAAQLPSVTPDKPPLTKILTPHGGEDPTIFSCPDDDKYFAAEGISFEYRDVRFAGKTRAQALVSLFSKKKRASHDVWLLYDFESVHGAKGQTGARNVLFADGHVEKF